MTSVEVLVENESGLHARPAAAFVQLASAFSSRIEVWNVTRGKGPASAKSIVSILGLGVSKGHQIRISADGEDAEAAVAGLRELILDGTPQPPDAR